MAGSPGAIEGLLAASAALGCAALGVALRMSPRLREPRFGIDTWYYLTYARALRRHRRWPVSLPFYLLDQPEQIYPPGLSWLLSWVPTRWLERSHWWLSGAVDAAHGIVLCALVWGISHAWPAVLAAGLLFATSPVLLSQATELNARPLGTLLFTLTMLGLWSMNADGGWAAALWLVAAGMAVLWTHKMTGQQLVAALLLGAVVWRDPAPVLFGAVMVLGSLALSRGWFVNILRSQRAIVRFWREHRPFLGAHQVYQSPLYADPEKARTLRGVSGVRESPWHRLLAVGHLAGIAGLVALGQSTAPAGSWERFGGWWVLAVYGTVAVTTWVPGLTQFGEGFKYLRYAVFPWSALLGLWAARSLFAWTWIGLAGLTLIQLLVVRRMIRAQRQNHLAAVDEHTRAALDALARQPEDGVLTLPFSRSESVAYFCEKRVLWGGHGGGWEQLAAFWPVLRWPVEAFFDAYDLHWLWLDTRYVQPEDLRLPPERFTPWLTRGPVRLFQYQRAPSGAGTAHAVSVSAC